MLVGPCDQTLWRDPEAIPYMGALKKKPYLRARGITLFWDLGKSLIWGLGQYVI